MKDASESYAPVVIPQPKDFSRRGPDGRPMTIAEKAERDRLASIAAASDIQSNPTSDANARPNRGFGVPYEMFSDELNTELDVTRIVQEMRQTGVEVNACHDPVSTSAHVASSHCTRYILQWTLAILSEIFSIIAPLPNQEGVPTHMRRDATPMFCFCTVPLLDIPCSQRKLRMQLHV